MQAVDPGCMDQRLDMALHGGLLGIWWAENPDRLLGLRTWGAETHGVPNPMPKAPNHMTVGKRCQFEVNLGGKIQTCQL